MNTKTSCELASCKGFGLDPWKEVVSLVSAFCFGGALSCAVILVGLARFAGCKMPNGNADSDVGGVS